MGRSGTGDGGQELGMGTVRWAALVARRVSALQEAETAPIKRHASAFSAPTLAWLPQCGAEPLCQRPPERAMGWGQARSPALLCERAPAVLLDPVRWQQPLLQNMGQTRELMCNSCTEAD